MKILIINHYAGSLRHGMEFRPYYLARDWVERGHEVTIVAANFSHVRSINPVEKKNGEVERIDDIRYIWLKTPHYRGNDWRRILNIFAFLFRLYRASPKLVKCGPFDAVIASSTYPLDIFPAHRIARKSGARLIYEVHDLWPLTPIELGGYSRRHPYIMLLQMAEDYAYKHSDRVVSLLHNAKEYMTSRGMNADKFVYLSNFFYETQPDREPIAELPAAFGIDSGKFVVGYLGTIGLSNCLENLLGAAEILKDHGDIQFWLVGDGPDRTELERSAAIKQLKNVRFTGRIAKNQVPSAVSRFDVCYLGFANKPIYRMGISPNKLFDYMAAARPVILAVNTGEDIVRESACGLTIEPENPQALAAAILALKALAPAERSKMGNAGKMYVMKNLTCKVVAPKFLEAMRP
jgi:glycosyltransferase involved in cell wall biosynthesis